MKGHNYNIDYKSFAVSKLCHALSGQPTVHPAMLCYKYRCTTPSAEVRFRQQAKRCRTSTGRVWGQ